MLNLRTLSLITTPTRTIQDPDNRVDKEEVIGAVKSGVDLLEGHVTELNGFLDEFREVEDGSFLNTLGEAKTYYESELKSLNQIHQKYREHHVLVIKICTAYQCDVIYVFGKTMGMSTRRLMKAV